MVYTKFHDSYARETAYANETSEVSDDIPDATATTYLFGAIGQTAVHPSFTATYGFRDPGINEQEIADGEIWKEILEGTGMYPVGMQNGVLLQAVMGGSVTTGTGPYTHTITPPAAVGGVLPALPSFVIQHERFGTSANWAVQFIGVKVAGLLLTIGMNQRYLITRTDWIAKKGSKVGFTLNNKAALPATANKAPYHINNFTKTWDVDGTPETIKGLNYMEFQISPDFSIDHAHTWDDVSQEYTGQWLRDLIEAPLKSYELRMRYAPESSVIWEELRELTFTKKIEFKWTRATDDYIKLTLTDCGVIGHTLTTPEVNTPDLQEVTIKPRAVSFEVKDMIPGSVYGE